MTDQAAPAPKKPAKKKTAAPKAESNGQRASLRRESIENAAKAQKAVAEYVAEQTSVATGYVKDRFAVATTSPAAAALDAAQEGVNQFAEAQKSAADWVAQPREKAEKTPAKQPKSRRLPSVPVRGLVHRGLQAVLDGQQELVGLARAQGNVALNTLSPLARGRFSDMPLAFIEATGKAVENLFKTQTRLLDLTTQYAGDAADLLSAGENAPLRKETAEALQHGTEATMGLQKKLLGIAEEQTQAALERLNPSGKTPAPVERSMRLDNARERLDRVADAQLRMLNRSREWVDKTFAAK